MLATVRGPKSLTTAQRERVRAALRDLRAKYATQKELEKALGVTQQSVSNALSGADFGVFLAAGVARALGVPLEELLTGQKVGSVPRYRDLPGWDVAAAEAYGRKRAPGFAIEAAGASPAAVQPDVVTTEFVERCAFFWYENAPLEERAAAEAAEAAAAVRHSAIRRKRTPGS